MAILRVRDETGKVTDIPAIKGDKGDNGDTPVKGKDYWTDADKEEIKSFISDEVGKLDVTTPVPTAIDLSGFESEGKIVETFADGSTETTVMELDSDGKPTKITDGNGNVTVLTW